MKLFNKLRLDGIIGLLVLASIVGLAIPLFSCATTSGGPFVADLTGKLVSCTTGIVSDKGPDTYVKVSQILTGSGDFTTKKNDLFGLAKKISAESGLELVSCLVRQYIADVTSDMQAGAVDPATSRGANDGREFLQEVHASFAEPAPAAGAYRRAPTH